MQGLCKHVPSTGGFVEKNHKNHPQNPAEQLHYLLQYFPPSKYLHGSRLAEQLQLWNLWASFFLLQEIYFLPVFAFLGTANAQSMAGASCQPRFNKSLLWAWSDKELGQGDHGQFWLWAVDLRSLSAEPKPLKSVQLKSWTPGWWRDSPEGEHLAGLRVCFTAH